MSKMSNIDIKYQLVKDKIFVNYCKYRYVDYLYNLRTLDKYNALPDETKAYRDFINTYQFTYTELHALEQMYDSRRKKVYRLKQKIQDMLQYKCIFLTLTFSDDVLQSTSAYTRRTYVARYLKKYNTRYVANIDFGQDDNFTKREHYHAIIQTDNVNFADWTCGIINGERVKVKNASALSKYINKITYHAYKQGAGSTRLIFSRGFIQHFNLHRVADHIWQGTFLY